MGHLANDAKLDRTVTKHRKLTKFISSHVISINRKLPPDQSHSDACPRFMQWVGNAGKFDQRKKFYCKFLYLMMNEPSFIFQFSTKIYQV